MSGDSRWDHDELPLEALERINRVCVSFEAAWKEGREPRIEDYLGAVEGEERAVLLRELLLLDLDYRHRLEKPAVADDYLLRFPHDCQLIDEVLGRRSTRTSIGERLSLRPGTVPERGPLPTRVGDYEIDELLGEGGMGTVYRARHSSVNRTVALKIVRPDRFVGLPPDRLDEVVRRFHVEVQAAAQLEHESIVPVYEVGEVAGQPFFAMRYFGGGPLDSVVRHGPLPANEAASVVEKIARAVHHAHSHGVIHRDLKPRNILLDSNGHPYVADFGLAKTREMGQELTLPGEVVGTPAYMAPEQAKGEASVDVAVDVYGLGATLYELLTGRPPFHAATIVETQRQVIDNDPVPPRELNSAVPRDLETICLKCLEKEPRSRYTTAEEVAQELDRYRTNRPIKARPTTVFARTIRWCKRNRSLSALGATAIAVVLALAVGGPIVAAMQAALRHRAERLASENLALLGKVDAALSEVTRQKEASDMHLYNARTNLVQRFVARHEVGPALSLLEELRPLPDEKDLRGFEWYYLWDHCHKRLLRTLRGHTDAVVCVVYSPDGRRLASASWDDTVRIWDATQPQNQPLICKHPASVRCVAFSPDGQMLVSGGYDRVLRVWDPRTGRLLRKMEGHGREINCVAFSPDSSMIASGSEDNTVRLWNADDGEPVRQPFRQRVSANGLVFSPDGKTLASAEYGQIKFWDVAGGECLKTFSGHRFWIRSLAFSPDGKTLYSGGNSRTVKAWNVDSGEERIVLDESGNIVCIDVSQDGKRLACGRGDGTILVRDLDSGDTRYLGHRDDVQWVTFSPDGSVLASGSADRTIRLWNLDGPVKGPTRAGEKRVWHLAFSPNGETVAASADKEGTYLIDVATERRRVFIPGGSASSAFSPDSRWLAAAETGRLMLWDTSTGRKIRTFEGSAGSVFDLEFSPDASLIASGGSDRKIRIWQVTSGRLSRTWKAFDGWVWWLAFSPDGEKLATASNWGTIKIWDVASGALVSTLPVRCGAEPRAAFSPDGNALACGDAIGEIHLWSVNTGQHLLTFEGSIKADCRLAFSPDGNTLASSNDEGSVTLWEVATGRERSTLNQREDSVYSLAFSPDGTMLVTGGESGLVEFWHAASEADVLSQTSLPNLHHELALEARGRANLLARHGRPHEAVEQYVKAIRILDQLCDEFPDTEQFRHDMATACGSLAVLWSGVSQVRHAEMSSFARRAVELAPGDPGGWLLLGVTSHYGGGYQKALPALEKAIALRSRFRGTDWFRLAMTKEALGSRIEAIEAYRRALAWLLLHGHDSEAAIRISQEAAQTLGVADHLRVPPGPDEVCNNLPKDLALLMDFTPDVVLKGCCETLLCDRSGSGNYGTLRGASVASLGRFQGGLICHEGGLRLQESVVTRLPEYTIAIRLCKAPGRQGLRLYSEYGPGGIVFEIVASADGAVTVGAFNKDNPDEWCHVHTPPHFVNDNQRVLLSVRYSDSANSTMTITANDRSFSASAQAVDTGGTTYAEIGGDGHAVAIVESVAAFRRALSDSELGRLRTRGGARGEAMEKLDWHELLSLGKTFWTEPIHPPRVDYSQAENVIFTAPDLWEGLHPVPSQDDGRYTVEERDGKKVIRPENYLYFKVDDSFAFDVPAGTSERLVVDLTLIDLARGRIDVQYDGRPATDSTFDIQASRYTGSGGRTLTGSAERRDLRFELPYAQLANRQNGKADFRLRSDSPYLVKPFALRSIRLSREVVPSPSPSASPKTIPRETEVEPGRWIDVLPYLNPDRHAVFGRWVQDGETVSADLGTPAMLALPIVIDGDYELEIAFARTPEYSSVSVFLPVGQHDCSLLFAGMGGFWHGIERIDGKPVDVNPTGRQQALLPCGRQYRLSVHVKLGGEEASIDVLLDGEPHVSWQGSPSSLSTNELIQGADYPLAGSRRVALAALCSNVQYQSVRFRLHSGTAEWVPDEVPASKTQSMVRPHADDDSQNGDVELKRRD